MYFQKGNRNLPWPLLLLTVLLPSHVVLTTGNSFVSALQIGIQSNANPNVNVWGYWCLAFPSQLRTDSCTALLFPTMTTLHFLCLEKNALCSSAATVFPRRKGSISKKGEAFLLLSRVENARAHTLTWEESCKTSGKTCHLAYEKPLVRSLWLWVHYKTNVYSVLPGSVTPSGAQFLLFKLLAYPHFHNHSQPGQSLVLLLESLVWPYSWKWLLTMYFFQFLSSSFCLGSQQGRYKLYLHTVIQISMLWSGWTDN